MTPAHKTCPRCRKDKPLDAFHRRADAPDGRQSWCKQCVADRQAAGVDADVRRARARAWAKADSVTRDRHRRTWQRAYRDALKAEGLEP